MFSSQYSSTMRRLRPSFLFHAFLLVFLPDDLLGSQVHQFQSLVFPLKRDCIALTNHLLTVSAKPAKPLILLKMKRRHKTCQPVFVSHQKLLVKLNPNHRIYFCMYVLLLLFDKNNNC